MQKKQNTEKSLVIGYDVYQGEYYLGQEVTREHARAVSREFGGRKAGVVIKQVIVTRKEVR